MVVDRCLVATTDSLGRSIRRSIEHVCDVRACVRTGQAPARTIVRGVSRRRGCPQAPGDGRSAASLYLGWRRTDGSESADSGSWSCMARSRLGLLAACCPLSGAAGVGEPVGPPDAGAVGARVMDAGMGAAAMKCPAAATREGRPGEPGIGRPTRSHTRRLLTRPGRPSQLFDPRDIAETITLNPAATSTDPGQCPPKGNAATRTPADGTAPAKTLVAAV